MTNRGHVGKVDGLQIDEEPRFLRAEWRVQRIGWVIMGLMVAGALAGAFGRGILSSREIEIPEAGARITYDALTRHRAPAEIRIELAPGSVTDSLVTVRMSRSLIDETTMASAHPEPLDVVARGNDYVYVFGALQLNERAEISMSFEQEGYWRKAGTISINDSRPRALTQFVLP